MINNLTLHSYIPNSSPQQYASRGNEKCQNESAKNFGDKTANTNEIKREPAKINFCGLFNSEKAQNFYRSDKLHSVLKFAKKQQLVFSAAYCLLLTCVLRPAAIVLSPSKKNKEDQIYASAHSIASGVIGFGISTVLFYPIGRAIDKLGKEHPEFVEKFGKCLKENSYLKEEAAYKTAKKFIDRAPDIITGIPKGILTIALIPPILKHVFGIEKKKPNQKQNINQQPNVVDYSLLNFRSAYNNKINGGVQ